MTPQQVSRDGEPESAERSTGWFETTHWSVVLAAGDSALPGAQEALEKLCRTYWYPLYAFVRLKGHSPEDAKDLTQAFFERFLEKHYVKNAAREKGRFRTFLLTALQRFLCEQFNRSAALKRGGGVPAIPVDALRSEAQLDQAAASCQNPELVFDRAWAETVVQTSVERLGEEYEAAGRTPLFAEFRQYLSRPANSAAYAASGRSLNLSVDAVAMAVVRLRRRYRELVRAEVANTVATPAEIGQEMRYLVDLLAH